MVGTAGAEDVVVGSGVGADWSLLCFRTNCEGWRLSLAKPREKLVRMSEGDLDSWGGGDRSRFRSSSISLSESEKREVSPPWLPWCWWPALFIIVSPASRRQRPARSIQLANPGHSCQHPSQCLQETRGISPGSFRPGETTNGASIAARRRGGHGRAGGGGAGRRRR